MTENKFLTDSTLLESNKTLSTDRQEIVSNEPFWFFVSFSGYMDMYSNLETVAKYLNAHEDWFARCAKPMSVEPIGNNGYVLNVGRFGSLGYEVEPKIAIVLDPPQDNLYVMRTIPVPDYESLGYEVQYKALMELEELNVERAYNITNKGFLGKEATKPDAITRVSWQLDLGVSVEFPKFIAKLPSKFIKTTGDRLLAQIVRQISPRLTYKVQQDFHNLQGLSLPGKNSRRLSRIEKECDFIVPTNNNDLSPSSSNDFLSEENNRVA